MFDRLSNFFLAIKAIAYMSSLQYWYYQKFWLGHWQQGSVDWKSEREMRFYWWTILYCCKWYWYFFGAALHYCSWGCNVHSAEDIAKMCDISQASAKIRAERMELLYRRNMFLTSLLERQVFDNFSEFIKNNRHSWLGDGFIAFYIWLLRFIVFIYMKFILWTIHWPRLIGLLDILLKKVFIMKIWIIWH